MSKIFTESTLKSSRGDVGRGEVIEQRGHAQDRSYILSRDVRIVNLSLLEIIYHSIVVCCVLASL